MNDSEDTNQSEVNDEIKERLYELFEYFELDDSGEWPMVSVYKAGSFYRGIIEDQLYEILLSLKQLVNESEEQEED